MFIEKTRLFSLIWVKWPVEFIETVSQYQAAMSPNPAMDPHCTAENCSTCPSRIVCKCLQITEEQLVDVLTSRPVAHVKELRQLTGAGDGCTCCHETLKEYLHRYSLAMAS